MGLLRRSCWQEFLPEDESKRWTSPAPAQVHLTQPPVSLHAKTKEAALEPGAQPEAALPQLSLQAVRSFWHQPYFTSTIIYCRHYSADGDCGFYLLLFFFRVFLQAGRAGSDRQTARGSSWKANLSSLNCSRRSNVAGEAKNLKVKSTRARLKDHFCVCRRSLEMRSARKPPALGPSSTAAAPGFQDQGGAEFISLRPTKLPEKCQQSFYGQKYTHGQSVWWWSVAQDHLKILLKWTVA